MKMSFDHLVLLVKDLDVAVRDFESLGFTVSERADTAHGSTVFRFISFADGSYILLTAFTSGEAMAGHRLGPVLESGEGWADYSFVVPDAHAAGKGMAAHGFPVAGPVAVSNVLADGRRWSLDLLMTGRGAAGDPALPFLVSDREGRNARIPAAPAHANGATGISGVRVTSANLGKAAAALVAMGGRRLASKEVIRIGFDRVSVDVIPLDGSRPDGGLVEAQVTGPRDMVLDSKLAHGAAIRMVTA
jgi:catechol 2,3-dioxygenase-like lactoylglutathione lyase family enzyme